MDKSYARRLALNSQIFKSPYWVLPLDDKGHENYLPVGRGVKSSNMCGKWRHLLLCRNVAGHAGLMLNGEDATGMATVHHSHLFCTNALCPVCYIRGYSVRRARSVTSRLEEGVRRGLGEVEHILCSVSPSDYDLEESDLRVKCQAHLKSLGISGFTMVFHGYRVDEKRQVLAWSAHYHIYGYVKGGYNCRGCIHLKKRACKSDCTGFYARAWKAYQKNDIYVKVFAKRKKSYVDDKPNVFGSVFYALNHATKRIGIKGSHLVTYFGELGNRKFATPKVVSEVKCVLCHEVMVRSVFVGFRPFVKDLGHADYKPNVLRPLFGENGEPNFIDKE